MYLVVWFDSGWNEVVVRQAKNAEEAEKILKECEDDVDCVDAKIIIL